MSEITSCYCRKCGAKLALSAEAVLKHYEKAHFSEWAANKDLMARKPKAFVVDSAQKAHTPKNMQHAVAAEARGEQREHHGAPEDDGRQTAV